MNFKRNGWAYFGLTQAYEREGIENPTPDQRKDYDSARKRLAEYCPPGSGACALSLDRMQACRVGRLNCFSNRFKS
ncbi:hypothetical protein [Burkholderia sp. D-99]|uniref:hypothetical protein n=1 Tax=Burkholderia sp. D-99 TaxID=2717316 RepID=UPI001AA1A741|nr:hypothetical protein [Burkholderia sp. D-99]